MFDKIELFTIVAMLINPVNGKRLFLQSPGFGFYRNRESLRLCDSGFFIVYKTRKMSLKEYIKLIISISPLFEGLKSEDLAFEILKIGSLWSSLAKRQKLVRYLIYGT